MTTLNGVILTTNQIFAIHILAKTRQQNLVDEARSLIEKANTPNANAIKPPPGWFKPSSEKKPSLEARVAACKQEWVDLATVVAATLVLNDTVIIDEPPAPASEFDAMVWP